MENRRLLYLLALTSVLGGLYYLDLTSDEDDTTGQTADRLQVNIDDKLANKTTTGQDNLLIPRPGATDQQFARAPIDSDAPTNLNPLAQIDRDVLTQTIERPLFAPDRQQPPIVTTPKPAPVVAHVKKTKIKTLSFDLLGVITDQGLAIALMRNKSDNTTFRFEVGDTVSGWKIDDIQQNHVLLSLGPKRKKLTVTRQ